MTRESGWFPMSQFSSGDAGRDLWAEQPGCNVRLMWDLLTYNFGSAGVVGFYFFFLECACEGIFIWVSEGEAAVWWEDIELL